MLWQLLVRVREACDAAECRGADPESAHQRSEHAVGIGQPVGDAGGFVREVAEPSASVADVHASCERARDDLARALYAIFDRHRMVRGQHDPSEVIQRIVWAVMRSLPGCRSVSEEQFRGWVFTVARRRVYSWKDEQERRDQVEPLGTRGDASEGFAGEPPSTTEKETDEATLDALRAQLGPVFDAAILGAMDVMTHKEPADLYDEGDKAALPTSSASLRGLVSVVKLVLWRPSLSSQDLADALGTSAAAVRQRKRRGIVALRIGVRARLRGSSRLPPLDPKLRALLEAAMNLGLWSAP